MNGQKKLAEEPLDAVSRDQTLVLVHLEVVRIVPPLVVNESRLIMKMISWRTKGICHLQKA